MAVHVVQGRDPWWGPLAVNILGGLYNDWQQIERNKKENVAIAEAKRMVDEQYATPEPVTATQDAGQGLLNMNGWADTFHKTDNPLAQFDLGTTGEMPTLTGNATTAAPSNAWANAFRNSESQLSQVAGFLGEGNTAQPAQRQRIPTSIDYMNALLQLLGTKRFGMLNADRMQAMLTPYLKANEEARQEQLRQNAANDYMNAGNDTDRLNQLYRSTILGITPQSVLTSGQERYKYDNPYLQQSIQNTGPTTRMYNVNPRTGEWTIGGEYKNGLTPQQAAANALSWANFNEGQRRFDTTMAYNREGRAWEQGYKDRVLAQENNQVTGQVFTGNDGYQYIMRRDGTPIKITDVPGLTAVQTQQIKINEDRIKELHKEREYLQKARNTYVNKGQSDAPDVAEIDKRLAELDKQEKEHQNNIYNIMSSVSTGQQGQNGQATETTLPPVAPPVNRYITQQEYDSYLREAERGTLTAKGKAIKNRQELDEYLSSKGYAVLGNSRETTPAIIQTTSPDVTVLGSGDISPDIAPNNISMDITNTESGDFHANTNTPANNGLFANFFDIFGATPAYADEHIPNNNMTLATDTVTEAGIQRALENLNGQFGEQRWADWATAFNPQDFVNNTAILQDNNLINITPTTNNAVLPIGSPNGLDGNMVLAGNRRARPQRVSLGRYSGDTRNGGQYSSIINIHAKANNVDPDLVAAIIQQESGGNGRAVSNKGAGGLMQLMPQTARGLGVTDVFDPEQNIAGGTKYIAQMLRRYKGNVEKALWAYNAGPGNADKGRLPDETKKYIPSVMARYRRLKGIAASTPNTPKRATRRRRKTRSRRKR